MEAIQTANLWLSLLIAFLAVILPGVMAFLYWTVRAD